MTLACLFVCLLRRRKREWREEKHTNDQSLRQGKAKQLCLKTTPFFSREKEKLPQAGYEPTMFCVLGRRSTN